MVTATQLTFPEKKDLNPILHLNLSQNHRYHLLKKTLWKIAAVATILASVAIALVVLYLSSQSLFIWDISKTTFAVLIFSPFTILFFTTFSDWSFSNEVQATLEKKVLTKTRDIQRQELSEYQLKCLFRRNGIDLKKISYLPLICLNQSEPLRALIPTFARYCCFIELVEEKTEKIKQFEDPEASKEDIWALSEEILTLKIKIAYMLYLMENPDSKRSITDFGKATPKSLSKRGKNKNFDFFSFKNSEKKSLTVSEIDGMEAHQLKEAIFYQ